VRLKTKKGKTMQREIKFRAWIPAGHWINKRSHGIFICDWQDTIFVDSVCFQPDKDSGIVVQQYTGLKDKNGKEIYEGDIVDVKMSYKGGVLPHVGEVVYDVNFCAFATRNLSGETLFHNHALHTIKVIGNIYENPELINPDGAQDKGKLGEAVTSDNKQSKKCRPSESCQACTEECK
jgi:uncharacterized phage protein (TIGR01671 family)